MAGIVMELSPCAIDPIAYQRKEVLCSPRWEERFGSVFGWPHVLRSPPYTFVDLGPWAYASRTVVGGELQLPDLRNDQVALSVEVYSNSYKLFVLLWPPRAERLRHRRIIVPGEQQRSA